MCSHIPVASAYRLYFSINATFRGECVIVGFSGLKIAAGGYTAYTGVNNSWIELFSP